MLYNIYSYFFEQFYNFLRPLAVTVTDLQCSRSWIFSSYSIAIVSPDLAVFRLSIYFRHMSGTFSLCFIFNCCPSYIDFFFRHRVSKQLNYVSFHAACYLRYSIRFPYLCVFSYSSSIYCIVEHWASNCLWHSILEISNFPFN